MPNIRALDPSQTRSILDILGQTNQDPWPALATLRKGSFAAVAKSPLAALSTLTTHEREGSLPATDARNLFLYAVLICAPLIKKDDQLALVRPAVDHLVNLDVVPDALVIAAADNLRKPESSDDLRIEMLRWFSFPGNPKLSDIGKRASMSALVDSYFDGHPKFHSAVLTRLGNAFRSGGSYSNGGVFNNPNETIAVTDRSLPGIALVSSDTHAAVVHWNQFRVYRLPEVFAQLAENSETATKLREMGSRAVILNELSVAANRTNGSPILYGPVRAEFARLGFASPK